MHRGFYGSVFSRTFSIYFRRHLKKNLTYVCINMDINIRRQSTRLFTLSVIQNGNAILYLYFNLFNYFRSNLGSKPQLK
jgi:hypothetical protein